MTKRDAKRRFGFHIPKSWKKGRKRKRAPIERTDESHCKKILIGFTLITALLAVGCGNDSGSSAGTATEEKTTGDIVLALVWKTPANAKTDMARSAPAPAFNADGTIDCDQSAISTIHVKIYDQAGGALLTDNGAGWKCSDHSGTIQNVPASKDGGDYRQLICLARDEQGNVLFGGEQADIHLTSNNTVQVRIAMEPLGTGHISAPSVVETSPADNAVNMSQTTTIRARFSKPINTETLSASSFIVSDGQSEIAGNITYNDTTATFAPAVPFATDTPYTVTLTTDIQDLFGIPLQADFTWSFTAIETGPPRGANHLSARCRPGRPGISHHYGKLFRAHGCRQPQFRDIFGERRSGQNRRHGQLRSCHQDRCFYP